MKISHNSAPFERSINTKTIEAIDVKQPTIWVSQASDTFNRFSVTAMPIAFFLCGSLLMWFVLHG